LSRKREVIGKSDGVLQANADQLHEDPKTSMKQRIAYYGTVVYGEDSLG
jgi:hypothetical protein